MERTIEPVVDSEECRRCGLDSRYVHPAGVVPAKWKCPRCGKHQYELVAEQIEEA